MLGIIGIIAFLSVFVVSVVITRLATQALVMTGLSEEAAHFQALSAFTGTGFTTAEAEHAVNHPVRRRIVLLLMMVRSAGLLTIVLSLVLSFAGDTSDVDRRGRLLWLVGGLGLLWVLSASRFVKRRLDSLIRWALKRWTDVDVRDYVGLLNLAGGYTVMEINLSGDDWLADKTLTQCRLPDEGVSILGINRSDGNYVGVPHGDTRLYAGDTLILYGRGEALKNLDRRPRGPTGDEAHQQAVADQQRYLRAEQNQEAEHARKLQEEATAAAKRAADSNNS